MRKTMTDNAKYYKTYGDDLVQWLMEGGSCGLGDLLAAIRSHVDYFVRETIADVRKEQMEDDCSAICPHCQERLAEWREDPLAADGAFRNEYGMWVHLALEDDDDAPGTPCLASRIRERHHQCVADELDSVRISILEEVERLTEENTRLRKRAEELARCPLYQDVEEFYKE